MRLIAFLITFAASSVAPFTHAKEAPFQQRNAQFLVESCQEAMDIFASQEQTGYLAAYRTSLSEAMRAGYCIGVIQSFLEANSYCTTSSDWFEHAKLIASLSSYERVSVGNHPHDILQEYICAR